jgi:hypothetical protein
MSANWTTIAGEDLRAIGDSKVTAEIMYIAVQELRPDTDDAMEGPLYEAPGSRYRRCVRIDQLPSYTSFELDDVDDFKSQACNYILIYRWLTRDERINLRLPSGLVVLRVVSNDVEFELLLRNWRRGI